MKKKEPVREFKELIEPIVINGKRFVPAQRLAQLAFNMTARATKKKCKMWVNNGYDFAMWYLYELKLTEDLTCSYSLAIFRNYDVETRIKTNGFEPVSNVGMPASNQVKIVKSLIEWGFIVNL